MDPDEYQRFPSFWPDPQLRKWNLWGYVDVRDVAAACRLGLEAAVTGSQNVIIAAANTVMNRPSRDVLAEVFPGVPLTREIGEFGTLLAIDRAKQVLGYEPRPLLARPRVGEDAQADSAAAPGSPGTGTGVAGVAYRARATSVPAVRAPQALDRRIANTPGGYQAGHYS